MEIQQLKDEKEKLRAENARLKQQLEVAKLPVDDPEKSRLVQDLNAKISLLESELKNRQLEQQKSFTDLTNDLALKSVGDGDSKEAGLVEMNKLLADSLVSWTNEFFRFGRSFRHKLEENIFIIIN